MKREPIGLNDRDGRPIFTGDLVEFYFRHQPIIGDAAGAGPFEGASRIVDIVAVIEDFFGRNRQAFFICEYGGSYAYRFNYVCKVIGRMPNDAHIFVDAMVSAKSATPEEREQKIKEVKAKFQFDAEPASQTIGRCLAAGKTQ